MKYLELLNQTAEETAKQTNELLAEEASIGLQSKLFEVKKKLAGKSSLLTQLKSSKELNFTTIVSTLNDIQLLEREQKQLITLQKELF
jgi:hypothetical protein